VRRGSLRVRARAVTVGAVIGRALGAIPELFAVRAILPAVFLFPVSVHLTLKILIDLRERRDDPLAPRRVGPVGRHLQRVALVAVVDFDQRIHRAECVPRVAPALDRSSDARHARISFIFVVRPLVDPAPESPLEKAREARTLCVLHASHDTFEAV